MTTAFPEAAPTTVDHLDFDVPCAFRRVRTGERCTDPVDWWILAVPHCAEADPTPRSCFACQGHLDRVMSGHLFQCIDCGKPHEIRPRVIRTERIR